MDVVLDGMKIFDKVDNNHKAKDDIVKADTAQYHNVAVVRVANKMQQILEIIYY
jgi:hypothetical protein